MQPLTSAVTRKGTVGVRKLRGTKITELRKLNGWDQFELAAAAHIAPSVVSRLERNLQADFKLSVVEAVAAALHVSIDSLLEPSAGSETENVAAELEAAIVQLRTRSSRIQRHVAGMIRGYLSVLDEED